MMMKMPEHESNSTHLWAILSIN